MQCITIKSDFPNTDYNKNSPLKLKTVQYCKLIEWFLQKSLKETPEAAWPVIYWQPCNLSHDFCFVGLTKQNLAKQRKCFQGLWKPALIHSQVRFINVALYTALQKIMMLLFISF